MTRKDVHADVVHCLRRLMECGRRDVAALATGASEHLMSACDYVGNEEEKDDLLDEALSLLAERLLESPRTVEDADLLASYIARLPERVRLRTEVLRRTVADGLLGRIAVAKRIRELAREASEIDVDWQAAVALLGLADLLGSVGVEGRPLRDAAVSRAERGALDLGPQDRADAIKVLRAVALELAKGGDRSGAIEIACRIRNVIL